MLIKLDDSLKQYYLGLKKNFTIYQIGYTVDFTSRYTYTIYEYLKSKANMKQCYISVDDARQQFAYGKYPNFFNFKKKVLDVAIREINEKTDLNVRYEATKKGVAYSEIAFFIAKKSGAALERVDKWKAKIPNKKEEMDALMNEFAGQMCFDDISCTETEEENNFEEMTFDLNEVT